jgi:hypothetical protein
MINPDDRFTPTGQKGVEISVGDSPERIEDLYDNDDAMSNVLYSKDLGNFYQTVINVDDNIDSNPADEVYIHVETGHEHNYVHFEYPGGTGFSLRLPTMVRNAE